MRANAMRSLLTRARFVMLAPGALLVLSTQQLTAQSVLVAPTAIVIDARSPSTPVTLVNTGDRPAEVMLSTTFGVPVTDSVGAMRLAIDSASFDSLPSAVSFIKVYPSRLVLAPGERRVVRVVADAPVGLPSREHWARLVVTSRSAASVAADGAVASGDASIALDLVVRSVLAVFWRPAGVTTAVTLSDVRVQQVGNVIECRMQLQRIGTAAFVGSVRATLRDERGLVRAQTQLPLGVYVAMNPALRFDVGGPLAAGTYELELEAVTHRPDVPSNALVFARPVRSTHQLQVR